MSEQDCLRKPEWIPYYIQRMKAAKAWKELRDYQFCWYWKLLTELADSDMPGFLPNDVGVLWKLAGAQTESFFRNRGGIELLARHFNRTEDGLRIYNERMLKVLHEQGQKLTKRRRRETSLFSVSLQELPSWVPGEVFMEYIEMRASQKKPIKTARALKLAVNTLERLKESGHNPTAVLEQSIFRSWAGLFPIEQVTNGKGDHGNGQAASNGGQAKAKSLTDPNCPDCQGTGWNFVSHKAFECLCRKRNKANAANGAANGHGSKSEVSGVAVPKVQAATASGANGTGIPKPS